jgi:hypothetical protein
MALLSHELGMLPFVALLSHAVAMMFVCSLRDV